ncbi:acyl-CoA dehydrogenase family protein [Streptosporangium sp. NPDC000239]|uniref:acyl-CoA dehydrogenase family protein n=1 Tax=Streptosporangium sp. NPDC000239 TaxID=3154248 RepID=UPI003316D1D4
MDFALSTKAEEYLADLTDFMVSYVYPAEPVYHAWRQAAGHGDHRLPPVVEDLKAEARSRGLWNLFLPSESGMSVLDHASLAEVTGRSPDLAPEALNCAAPDTGNMELLHTFGSPEQRARWLTPLLAGGIRSAFAMSEPAVASSDATNLTTSIVRDGDDYVVNGRKWFVSGAADPRCRVVIVLGNTDPEAPAHRRQSTVLVPMDTPGVEVVRHLPVFGYQEQRGYSELVLSDVRVPVANLLGEEGDGLRIARTRLGPGRVHHCMRAIGMAERALELLCARAANRVAFGVTLAQQGVVQQQIAESRLAIDQARLLGLRAAWMIDTVGAKAASAEISAVKAVAPRVACEVIDRAIQVHGAQGVSDDVPLASMYVHARAMRILGGPDEVHLRAVARRELKPHLS